MKKVVNYIHSNNQWFYSIRDYKVKRTYFRQVDLPNSSGNWIFFAEGVSKSKVKKMLQEHFGDEYEYAICYFYHYVPNWYHSKRRGSREYGLRRRNTKYIFAKYDYIGDIDYDI